MYWEITGKAIINQLKNTEFLISFTKSGTSISIKIYYTVRNLELPSTPKDILPILTVNGKYSLKMKIY